MADNTNTVEIVLMDGCEGQSLYLDGYRVAGPKPWGGGTVRRTWRAKVSAITTAIGKKLPKGGE